ncbi:MAG: anion permease [Candidatus Omnitrophica bacterium]|nr:anion permease [Candidatus Omnitrophota bacterium]
MIEILFCLLAGLVIGWSIGANDAANTMGTSVGSKALTVRQAIILICIFGTAGALLQGHHVIKTMGKGIVPLHTLPAKTALMIAVAASFSAGFWVVVACYRKLPISTSHSVVGAVAGAGLAVGAPVKWAGLGKIFMCWILTPFGSATLAILIYFLFRYFIIKVIPDRFSERFLVVLLIASGCYDAYAWGANDVANATGVMIGVLKINPIILAAIGVVAICVGVSTWGYRVMETVGSRITQLLPIMAVAAQIGSAINVNVYTVLGIPVSTSHSIVGAVLGVGLIHHAKLVRLSVMAEIVFSWAITPLIAGAVSFGMIKMVQMVI